MTAEAIRRAQICNLEEAPKADLSVLQLPVLREQDFGFYEGKPFYTRTNNSSKSGKDIHHAQPSDDPDFKDVESKESMALRMNEFLDEHMLPMIQGETTQPLAVAVVSHGIILSTLWKCLLKCFAKQSVTLAPGILIGNRGMLYLEHLGGWSNTGYLELDIHLQVSASESIAQQLKETQVFQPQLALAGTTVSLPGSAMTIQTINGKEHLKGLKRTGGGVGSSKFDGHQKTIESFFKKRKVCSNG